MKAECHALKFAICVWVEVTHEFTHSFAMATNGLQTVSTWRVKEQTSCTGLVLCMLLLPPGSYTFTMDSMSSKHLLKDPDNCWQNIPYQMQYLHLISNVNCKIKRKTQLQKIKFICKIKNVELWKIFATVTKLQLQKINLQLGEI